MGQKQEPHPRRIEISYDVLNLLVEYILAIGPLYTQIRSLSSQGDLQRELQDVWDEVKAFVDSQDEIELEVVTADFSPRPAEGQQASGADSGADTTEGEAGVDVVQALALRSEFEASDLAASVASGSFWCCTLSTTPRKRYTLDTNQATARSKCLRLADLDDCACALRRGRC
jgi:hypothetical protein